MYLGHLEYIAVQFCTFVLFLHRTVLQCTPNGLSTLVVMQTSFHSSFEYTLHSTWRLNEPTQAQNAQKNKTKQKSPKRSIKFSVVYHSWCIQLSTLHSPAFHSSPLTPCHLPNCTSPTSKERDYWRRANQSA